MYNDEPLRETFARLARCGYDAVELKGELAHYSVAEVNHLRAEFGLAVSSILGWSIWPIPGRDLADTDPAERAVAVRYIRDCVDFASASAAPVVIVLPFPAGRTAPLSQPKNETEFLAAAAEEWQNAVASVKEAAAYAAQKGVTLAIEPINRFETYQIITVDDALRFLAEVDAENVGINLDAFHMNIEEPNPAEAVRKAGGKLVHMHAADSNRMPPGRGHTNFRAILTAMAEVGFQGTMILEPVPPGADPGLAIQTKAYKTIKETYAEESIRYLNQLEEALAAV